jgi:Phage integrase, N-terminal SAM-like domain
MNRRPLNSLPLQKAITGFVNYKTAEGLSDRSVDSYRRILERWAEFAGNKNVAQFTDHDINSYLFYIRTEYVPSRWSRDTRNLPPKTLRNIWITMCSFFRWANSEFHIESPMKNVPAPRFQKLEIEPLTREGNRGGRALDVNCIGGGCRNSLCATGARNQRYHQFRGDHLQAFHVNISLSFQFVSKTAIAHLTTICHQISPILHRHAENGFHPIQSRCRTVHRMIFCFPASFAEMYGCLLTAPCKSRVA